jgi:exopolyphosphatase/guanosine-5'-triphosphate,3'-diphosphate pyrophosphatase
VADHPFAVIDLGSNSGRIVVIQVGRMGHLEILADGRSPLRLGRDVVADRTLSESSVERTVAALRDFASIAAGAGAGRAIAVATSAVREAENGAELLERIRRESGLELAVIDGDQEARYAFLGAVRGLQVLHGLVADVGGGSMEVTRFRDRRPTGTWTLPLGALKLSDRFLGSDPPSEREIERLIGFTHEALRDAGIGSLADDEHLVGTGGTTRNLARMDQRARAYPIDRLHGYVLARRRVDDLVRLLASRPLARRRRIRGLNADRADSVVGGAIAVQCLMEALGAPDVVVSGQGLREGVVHAALGEGLPPPDEVREESVTALAARFARWDANRAELRRKIAQHLVDTIEPDAGQKLRDRLDHAATLLDVGRSIDYYERYAHAADIVLTSDLAGFSHRKLALLAAVLRKAGDEGFDIRAYRPLVTSADRVPVARAAAILELADEIEHRTSHGTVPAVRCEVRRRAEVLLTAPIFDPYRQSVLAGRMRRAFGKRLVIQAMGDPRGSGVGYDPAVVVGAVGGRSSDTGRRPSEESPGEGEGGGDEAGAATGAAAGPAEGAEAGPAEGAEAGPAAGASIGIDSGSGSTARSV